MAKKSFAKPTDRRDPHAEPHEFELIEGQWFALQPDLSANVQGKLFQVAQIGTDKIAVPDMIGSIRAALVTERWQATPTEEDAEAGSWEPTDDVSRFDFIINSPERDGVNVTSTRLQEVFEWMMGPEVYGGGRPTQRSGR